MNLPSPTEKNNATFNSTITPVTTVKDEGVSPKGSEIVVEVKDEAEECYIKNEVRQAREIFTSRRDNPRPKQQWGKLR